MRSGREKGHQTVNESEITETEEFDDARRTNKTTGDKTGKTVSEAQVKQQKDIVGGDYGAFTEPAAEKPEPKKTEKSKAVKTDESTTVLRADLTGPAGLNSIDVRLPVSGKKFVFSKKIIDRHETYPLMFSYVHTRTRTLMYSAIGIALLLAIMFFVSVRMRKRRA
jgi:hypothetical protein